MEPITDIITPISHSGSAMSYSNCERAGADSRLIVERAWVGDIGFEADSPGGATTDRGLDYDYQYPRTYRFL